MSTSTSPDLDKIWEKVRTGIMDGLTYESEGDPEEVAKARAVSDERQREAYRHWYFELFGPMAEAWGCDLPDPGDGEILIPLDFND